MEAPRRATLGGESRYALSLDASGTGRHPLAQPIPPGAKLNVAFGVHPTPKWRRGSVLRFTLSFASGGETHTLLRRLFRRGTKRAPDQWHSESIDLGEFAGKTGTLVFDVSRANGQPAPSAVWALPQLVFESDTPGPNVVLVSVDTLRADHLGCYGYDKPTSPNLDRLASEGVLFRNALATSNWTLPSHASLFTGLYPSHHGANRYGLGTPIPARLDTLPELLRGRGYETIGFVGGVFVSAKLGFDQGFDRYLDPGFSSFLTVPFKKGNLSAMLWMALRPKHPFFLFLHTYDVHMPYAPSAPYDLMFDPEYSGPYLGRFTASDYTPYRYTDALAPRTVEHISALYDGGIRQMDAQIGRLLDFVEAGPLAHNTCIVFTSDHGEEFKEHGNLLHHTAKLFEELIRVPLIVWCPSRIPGGRVVDDVVSLVDLLPTLLELTGSPVPENIDGVSFYPVLSGGALAEGRVAIAEVDGSTEHKPGSVIALRSARYKLVSSTLNGPERLSLYDLEEDPGETRDLTDERKELAQRMVKQLRRLLPDAARSAAGEDGGEAVSPQWDADPATRERLRELGYIQ